jgi:hypothetical protein
MLICIELKRIWFPPIVFDVIGSIRSSGVFKLENLAANDIATEALYSLLGGLLCRIHRAFHSAVRESPCRFVSLDDTKQTPTGWLEANYE